MLWLLMQSNCSTAKTSSFNNQQYHESMYLNPESVCIFSILILDALLYMTSNGAAALMRARGKSI